MMEKKIQFKDEKRNKWFDFDFGDPKWNWETFDYRVKPESELPETWEDFCKTRPIKEGETRITIDSNLTTYKYNVKWRHVEADKNVLPNRRYAEALLALCQLVQLRDCYNEGWQPNWEDFSIKYKIEFYSNEIVTRTGSSSHRILTFKTEKLRDEFLENFRDLIEIAKPLL